MEQQDNEKSVMVSVLAGIGIGVIVGAIAGLLFAPRTGTETRETIGTTLKDLGNKIADLSQEVTAKVRTVVENTKQEVQAAVESSEDTAASA
jgi:gas vesicle protein